MSDVVRSHSPSHPAFARQIFDTSRAAEYFDATLLVSQTAQPINRFAVVVMKELLDNAFDAAETAGVSPNVIVTTYEETGIQVIKVADNGGGMPSQVIERILDFSILVSDKAHYCSPTRGQQGNGLKTVIGIPYALGETEPIVIESGRTSHIITPTIDAAGVVHINHRRRLRRRLEEDAEHGGTTITVTLPADAQQIVPEHWCRGFALVNPHAAVIHHAEPVSKTPTFYKPTASDTWRKPMPTNPTSPHWYNEGAFAKLVTAHNNAARRGGPDYALGEFVRTFAGLVSTPKAKAVRDRFSTDIGHLSDLEGREDLMAELLAAMKDVARLPNPAEMGRIDKEHFKACFEQWYGVPRDDRFWHRRVEHLTEDGIPWVADIAIAHTQENGEVFFATNYSPTYSDPLSGTWLIHQNIQEMGAESFLRELDAWPGERFDDTFAHRAVLVHLVTPTASFLEKGKSTLDVPEEVADQIARAMFLAAQKLAKEHRARQRTAAQAERAERSEEEPPISLKDAAWEVMDEAIAAASGDGTLPFSAHTLFYQVRPLIQEYTDEELDSQYFEQTLVVDYQKEHGLIIEMYREARGVLTEPHGGQAVPLGTREVAEYEFPEYVFGAILFVEKKGLMPVWRSARLGDRFDTAIASGEGQPTEAARVLFKRAEEGEYWLGVLHDCDHSGYSIAHTLAEATKRMPGYQVNVVDIGLKVADAIRLGLPTETYIRSRALPKWMLPELTEHEREWFEGTYFRRTPRGTREYRCTRVELNAFTSDALVAFVEEKLTEAGVMKSTPPDDVIADTAQAAHHDLVKDWVTEKVAELLDLEAIAEGLVSETSDDMLDDPARWITDAYEADRAIYWRDAIDNGVGNELAEHEEALTVRLRQELGLDE